MTREEAIEQIYTRISKEIAYKEQFYSVIEALERVKEPISLADFLGWEEGQEYNWKGITIKIEKNNIYEKNEKCSSNWCNFCVSGEELLDLRQAKKVVPRYLLQTDLTSENGIQYLSFDKKRREYFMGALMTSENVQQKFTDSEILKIESITRFAKLCEKVEVEE